MAKPTLGVQTKRRLFLLVLTGLSILSLILGFALGSVRVPFTGVLSSIFLGPNPGELAEPQGTWHVIVWTLRLPRVLLAFAVGASLSVAGAVMQGLFRNPMADPFVLGVSSGASLGAVFGIALGLGRALGLWALPFVAFLGAVATTAIVYVLSTHKGYTDTWTLLLSGIAVSSFVSSIIALVMVLSRERMEEIVFWTLGALTRATWKSVAASLVYIVPGIFMLWRASGALNALSIGDEPAFHLGVPVEKAKRSFIWVASLITAGGVAFTGPVGFVGLIVPHAVRLIAGPDHKWLLPLSAFLGGNVLILSDLLARTVSPPKEIPVGVITALAGAPFFLYLLYKARRQGR